MAEDRPTVILTRPERASRRFAEALDDALDGRAEIIVAPIMEIVPIPVDADFAAYPTVILTSANAIEALADPASLAGRLAYCVGDRTAQAATDAGMRAVSASGDAAALMDRLLADAPPGPWLHLSGEHRSTDLAEALSRSGHETHLAVVYRQEPRKLSERALETIRDKSAVLPVFSPRSAALLASAMPHGAQLPVVVAISRPAAAAWHVPSRNMRIAPKPDAIAMIETIRDALRPDSPC